MSDGRHSNCRVVMARFRSLKKVLHDTKGATAVEYGLIIGLVVLAVFVAIQGVATETIGMWNSVSTKSANAISGQ